MQGFTKRALTRLAPILGAGVIGVCPLYWVGSASLLTYAGLGALIPAWRWIAFGLIGLGAVGFILDYRSHKNPYPLVLIILGAALLYVGRYLFLSTWGAWQIWVPGALLIVIAVVYNKRLFRKPASNTYACPECNLRYRDRAKAEACEAWCKAHHSCNLDIIQFAESQK